MRNQQIVRVVVWREHPAAVARDAFDRRQQTDYLPLTIQASPHLAAALSG
jgi:hypothetical protein